MSRIVTTKLGRFRAIIDGEKKSWLWECRHCKTWRGLNAEQWEGRVSVYCDTPVREYYGLNPLTDMKPCGYHQTHEFAKELVLTIQARLLFGEEPYEEDNPSPLSPPSKRGAG